MKTFHTWCAACHGPLAIGGGTIPNLRKAAPATCDILPAIVLEVARAQQALTGFGRWLTRVDVTSLRARLLDRRAAWIAEQPRVDAKRRGGGERRTRAR